MRYSIFLLVFLGLALVLGGCGQPTTTSPIREFPLSTTCGHGVHQPGYACTPTGITTGPDGNLWFTESLGNQIGRVTPAGGFQNFPLPTTCNYSLKCGPDSIITGPDGALWFTESSGNRIGRITPAGTIQEFALPTNCNNSSRCGPAGITSGPGDLLWFTESSGNQIGQYSPQK